MGLFHEFDQIKAQITFANKLLQCLRVGDLAEFIN